MQGGSARPAPASPVDISPAEQIKSLQKEISHLSDQAEVSLRSQLYNVRNKCREAQELPIGAGKKEVLRQIGEQCAQALDRLVALDKVAPSMRKA